LLCRVCTSWKTLVQSTPKLWSSFGVDVPAFDPTGESYNIGLLRTMETWLSRSKKYPLSVRICHDPIGRIPDTRTTKLLAALVPHAHRWRDIHLLIPNSTIAPLQNSLPPPEGFPALRSLTLDMRALWASHAPLDVRALGIPWGQLTDLHLRLDNNHLLTLDHCIDILAESVNLARCTLNADCTFHLQSSRSEKVFLHSLQSLRLILQRGEQRFNNGLRLTETPETCVIAFLEQLQFHRLHTLEIEWLVQWEDDNRHWSEIHSRFISLLESLNPQLKTLSLAYLPLSETEILDSLATLPNLTNLGLRFSLADRDHDPISDDFLHALTIQPGNSSPHLLQHLESLQIQCDGGRCTTSTLLNLIQSRWTTPSPMDLAKFKAFTFVSLKPVGSYVRQRVKSWGDAGLAIIIDGVEVR
jgi:hypothetical protein